MKALLRIVLAGFVAGLILLGTGWYFWTAPMPGMGNSSANLSIRIPQGATWTSAADSLTSHRLLRHPLVLNLGVRLLGKGRDLKAGLYALPQSASPRTLLTLLTEGKTVPVRVTLPEGWNAEEMAAEVARCLGFSADDFLAAADRWVRDLALGREEFSTLARCDSLLTQEVARLGSAFHVCEGYLAPDTYFFAEGSNPREVAKVLVSTQMARLAETAALARAPAARALDQHQLLTLASIVEAEARLASEQPQIAAVYLNRLQKHWKLEADPTVAFALHRKGTRLLHKDLAVDSAYNTYLHAGLPLGPIGSPGRGALLAVVQPDTTCRAMFFVSDGGKGHFFSITAAEHNQAVKRFRKIRDRERRLTNGR